MKTLQSTNLSDIGAHGTSCSCASMKRRHLSSFQRFTEALLQMGLVRISHQNSVGRAARPPFHERRRGQSPCNFLNKGLLGKSGRDSNQTGAALLITLAILAMMVMLLLTFLTNVLIERQVAGSSTDEVGARMVAQAGTDCAINLLTFATPDPLNYITAVKNPGWTNISDQHPYIEVYTVTADYTVPPTFVTNLVSGLNQESDDLNRYGAICATNRLKSPFQWSWLYLTNSSGDLYGRYAFWCDDETTKFNFATWGRGLSEWGAEDSFMLNGLPGDVRTVNIDNLNQARRLGADSETVETAIGMMSDPLNPFVRTNALIVKLYATAYSHDSDSNFMGNPKLNLIPLAQSNITQIADAVSNAYPKVADKYSINTADAGSWLAFAANLKEYMNTNSNSQPTNENLSIISSYDGKPYKVIGRSYNPFINEFGMETSVSFDSQSGGSNFFSITNRLYVELFNIWGDKCNYMTSDKIEISELPQIRAYSVTNGLLGSLADTTIRWGGGGTGATNGNVNLSGSISAFTNVTGIRERGGAFNFPTNEYQGLIISNAQSAQPVYLAYSNTAGLIDYAYINMEYPSLGTIASPILPTVGDSTFVLTNKAVILPGDPRINHEPQLWTYAPITSNDFNKDFANASLFRPDLGMDQDDLNDIINNQRGFWQRAGKSVSGNRNPIDNAAEIGTISLGWNTTNGMWRTLKFYGDGRKTATDDEDYKILDYITATNRPWSKINLNTAKEDKPSVGGDSASGTLSTFIKHGAIPTDVGCTNWNNMASELGDDFPYLITTAIVNHVQNDRPYRSIGEFLEINTNMLERGDYITDFTREAPLRGLINYMTTRGEQFAIYSLGQRIQVVQGKTNVLGEAMIETVVERVQTSGGIYYRPVHHRLLSE